MSHELLQQEFQLKFQEEQEMFKRERHRFLVEEATKKREIRKKEADYNEFKIAQEKIHFERAAKGRSFATEAEDEAKRLDKEKRDATKAKIEAAKAEAKHIEDERRAREKVAKQKEREVAELITMKKEEQRCFIVELEFREALKVAMERKEQVEREEKVKKLKADRAEREAEEKRLAEEEAKRLAEERVSFSFFFFF